MKLKCRDPPRLQVLPGPLHVAIVIGFHHNGHKRHRDPGLNQALCETLWRPTAGRGVHNAQQVGSQILRQPGILNRGDPADLDQGPAAACRGDRGPEPARVVGRRSPRLGRLMWMRHRLRQQRHPLRVPHHRLADQHRVEAAIPRKEYVLGVKHAGLEHPAAGPVDPLTEFHRGEQIHPERPQIAAVDPHHRRPQRSDLLEVLRVVDLHQRGDPARRSLLQHQPERVAVQDRGDEQDRVGAGAPRDAHVLGVQQKVLAQHRELRMRRFHGDQIAEGSGKMVLLRQDADRTGAAPAVLRSPGNGVQRRRQVAAGGAAALDFTDERLREWNHRETIGTVRGHLHSLRSPLRIDSPAAVRNDAIENVSLHAALPTHRYPSSPRCGTGSRRSPVPGSACRGPPPPPEALPRRRPGSSAPRHTP